MLRILNKKIFFLLGIFAIISGYILFDMNVKNNCKSLPKVIKSINDFGLLAIKGCKNPRGIKPYLRTKTPSLFQILSSIKDKYSKRINRNQFSFEELDNKEHEKLQKKYFPEYFGKNLKIDGLINTNFIPKSSGSVYEYSNNSYRQNKDNSNSKFYTSSKITVSNIHNLELAWKFRDLPINKISQNWMESVEISPLYANGKIFYMGAGYKLIAMNPENGNILWSKQLLHQPARRGFLWDYDKLNNKESIYLPTGNLIIKLDALTGKVDKNFGDKGYVDLKLSTKFSPIVYDNNIIVMKYSGELQSINKNNGKINFSINTHNDKNFWGGVPWGGMALDEKNSIIYTVVGNPRPGTYGVTRTGSNKNANSLVALDLNKKKIIWSFQETSHDLWDLDIAFPPMLITLNINGQNYDCVIVSTKLGNVILLERLTGNPIFDIKYKKTPRSTVPSEVVSPYQLYIEKPEPMTTFEFSEKNINKLDEKTKKNLFETLKDYDYGWFKPPRIGVPLIYMANGPAWEGGAIDPINKKFYSPVNQMPTVINMNLYSRWPHIKIDKKFDKSFNLYLDKCSACHGKNRIEKITSFQFGLDNVANFNPELQKSKDVPNLVGFHLFDNLTKKIMDYENFINKHNNIELTKEEYIELNKLFKYWDEDLKKNNLLNIGYRYSKFGSGDLTLFSNPPYGEILAYDLESGLIDWRVPFGKITKDGKELNTGSFNKGGIAATKNGVIFATGTTDNKIIALNSKNGEEIWSYQMETAGTAPPIIYTHNGKDYVTVIATGLPLEWAGDNSAKKTVSLKDSTIYTFKLN
jgi:quinoprotein glucose dehydrogenase